MDFYISVTSTRTAKEHYYEDAFADDGGEAVLGYSVRYGTSTIQSGFCQDSDLETALAVALHGWRVLRDRIDGAEDAWDRTKAEREAAEAEASEVTE